MDSLEKFFRDRALQKDVDFHEADWVKLEKQLDKEMPDAFFLLPWLKRYWWIPVLILLLPMIWFGIEQFGSNAVNNDLEKLTLTARTAVDAVDDNQTFVPFDSKSDISAQNNIPKEEAENSIVESVNIAGADYVQDADQHSKNYTVKTTEDRGYVVLENGVRSFEKPKVTELHFLSPLSPSFLMEGMPPPDWQLLESTEKVPSDMVNKASKTHGVKVYLGLGYSPDFSTVGIGDFTSPGTRWKFMVEVGFGPKLLLHTGITKVHNKYTAYGEDYHAPYGYWKNGIVADEAYGTCDMVDVPLNLRYNFLTKNRHQLFISGGASTYFLTKEEYHFEYTQDDPYLPDEWSTDKMSVYPFGIINISMGYQYNIGQKGAFQFEPFIKIPTSGIGWGEVDLHTMGAYFIYKYRLGK